MNGEAEALQEEVEDRIFCQNIKQEKLPKCVTKVEIIFIESLIKFSAINRKHKLVFLDIRHCLNALYQNAVIDKEICYIPKEDELVVAFFKGGRCWCRGKVMEVHPDYTATIRYVDYGNVKRIPFYMLRKPDEVLQHFNFQAIDMQIADAEVVVEQNEMSESDKWRFQQIMPRRRDYMVTDTYGRKKKLPRLEVVIEDCATRTDIRGKLIEIGFIRPIRNQPACAPLPGSISPSVYSDADGIHANNTGVGTISEAAKKIVRSNCGKSEGDFVTLSLKEQSRCDECQHRTSLPAEFGDMQLAESQYKALSSEDGREHEHSKSERSYDCNESDLPLKKKSELLHRLSPPSGPSSEMSASLRRPDISMSALKRLCPGKELEIRVMHVGETNLYIHDMAQSGPRLRHLMTDMKKHYASVPPMRHRPPVNSVVVARPQQGYAWNGEYNRAYVQSWPADSDDQVTVFFVDYGETATVPLLNVRMLDPVFMKYEFQAVAAQMDGLKPDQHWPLAIRERVVRVLTKKILKAKVIERLKDMVILSAELLGQSFSDFLIKMGLEKDDCQRRTIPRSPASLDARMPAPKGNLSGESQVVVLHVETTDNFWVIQYSKIQEFCDLGENLKAAYSIAGKPYIPKREGELVANFCSKSDEYFRAVVLKIQGQSVLVKNIDWGYEEVVALTDLYRIEEEFLQMPVYAVHCTLGVTEIPGKTVDKALFGALKMFWHVQVEGLTRDKQIIDLSDDGGVSFRESLIKNGLVKELDESSESADIPTSSGRKLPPRYMPSTMNQLLPVVVVESRWYDEIYVHVIEEEAEKMAQCLADKLREVYEGRKRPRMIVAPGDFVIVQYGAKNTNYRAIVQERFNNKFRVHFADFGNDAIVERSSMAPLTQQLREFPRLAVRCKLSRVVEDKKRKWPAQLVSEASHAVFRKQLGDVMMVDLLSPNQTNITDKLIKMGLVKLVIQPVPKSSEATVRDFPRPEDDDRASEDDKPLLHCMEELPQLVIRPGLDCIITFIESPKKFFIQIHDDDNWHVEQVTTFLQRYYAKKGSQLRKNFSKKCLEADGLVVARFPVDNKLYRAKLVGKVAWDEWCVFFIDFGDTEVVNVDSILPLADVFINIPPLAVQVSKFIGVDQRRVSTEDLCIYLLKELTLESAECLKDHTYAMSLTLEDGNDLGFILAA